MFIKMIVYKVSLVGELIKIVIFIALTIVNESSCFCEESYIIICDNLQDCKVNDTTTWRHVMIGSNQNRREPPSQILNFKNTISGENLKSLTIIYQVVRIQPFTLYTMPRNLEYLNFYENNIKNIEDYTFRNFPKIKEIYLDNNKIEYLGRSIFKNTTLDIVSLSRNKIESVTTAFYESKIKWIKLNQNKLNFIKSESFPASLERLELNHNFLEILDEDIFRNLGNLRELSIKHNRLKVLPNISPLKHIQYLHFSYNNIERLFYNFSSHEKLEFLDLSSNLIYNLTADIFSSKGTPPLVLLMFNRLTDMKFVNPERKTDLGLDGNPWICDCLMNIERIIFEYKHMSFCKLECFKKGIVPLCIENGICGENELNERDVDNFINLIGDVSYKSKDECNFYL